MWLNFHPGINPPLLCLHADYDAPVAENGELTEKWYLTKRLLQEYLPQQGLPHTSHLTHCLLQLFSILNVFVRTLNVQIDDLL